MEMGALSIVSTVVSLIGSISSANASANAAEANARYARQAAEANRVELERQAIQEGASGQQRAIQDLRKARLMASAFAARAASGGAGVDPSMMAGILEEGDKQAGFTMYETNERANSLRHKGAVGVYEAKAQGDLDTWTAKRAAKATMLGAALKAGDSMFERFAPGPAPTADLRGNNPDEWNVGYR